MSACWSQMPQSLPSLGRELKSKFVQPTPVWGTSSRIFCTLPNHTVNPTASSRTLFIAWLLECPATRCQTGLPDLRDSLQMRFFQSWMIPTSILSAYKQSQFEQNPPPRGGGNNPEILHSVTIPLLWVAISEASPWKQICKAVPIIVPAAELLVGSDHNFSPGTVGVRAKAHVRKHAGTCFWMLAVVLVADAWFWLISQSFRWMECKPHTNYWKAMKETPFSVCLSIHPSAHPHDCSVFEKCLLLMEGWKIPLWSSHPTVGLQPTCKTEEIKLHEEPFMLLKKRKEKRNQLVNWNKDQVSRRQK